MRNRRVDNRVTTAFFTIVLALLAISVAINNMENVLEEAGRECGVDVRGDSYTMRVHDTASLESLTCLLSFSEAPPGVIDHVTQTTAAEGTLALTWNHVAMGWWAVDNGWIVVLVT